ncbi:MAG TPA: TauD/TfdA family dioxygenase [Acidimicrobiales bacterium]|nr:TauD/TfdA family dioxygenase [Acidimicrobiales bacterium]
MEHTALSTVGLFDERPMAGHIGVEVHGIDVLSLDDRQVAELRRLWLDNLIVVFVGQDHVDRNGLASFAGRFGPLYRHPLMMTEQSDPVHAINIPAGGYWHSDVTFAPRPPMATMLHAQTLPPKGGDTLWANMYLAYESLSAPMRSFLDGLSAVHDLDHFYRYPMGDSLDTDQFILDQKRTFPSPTHPVVLTHPETGRKALFVNESFTSHIVGLTKAESAALLDFLYRHSVRPEFSCRHRWSRGDICLWDNRCTMHYPVDDWGGSPALRDASPRKMNRVTIGFAEAS